MLLPFLRTTNLVESFLSAAEPEALLLLAAIGFYLAGLLIGRILRRRLAVGLGWTYQIFIAATAVLIAAALFHFDLPGQQLVGMVALFSAAFPFNALLYRYFWPIYGYPGEQARVPPFLPQIITLLLIATGFFTGLSVFYGVTLPGLLAGSGLIALVLGLALQDTLGNIFSGLGLQAGKAFRVGDWLIVEGKHVEVIEVNWRSTRLRNVDAASFDIPNNQLAKATIVNLYNPTSVHAARASVCIEYRVPPNRVKDALIRAALAARGVLSRPAPAAFLMNFDESGIRYELKYWIDDARRSPEISDVVRTNVWYELDRRGIPFSYPTRIVEMRSKKETEPTDQVSLLLKAQPLFADMETEQIQALAKSAQHLRYGKGEKIISQGDPGRSMYVLSSGIARVTVERDGRTSDLGELVSGECFGEISLLTGKPRTASVTAKTDCEILEIDKSGMGDLLKQYPRLADHLSETLSTRRSMLETELANSKDDPEIAPTSQTKESFLARIRQLFGL
jgi:small-conductance mechanosensitive channel/CRP-like cAMP-binding protein